MYSFRNDSSTKKVSFFFGSSLGLSRFELGDAGGVPFVPLLLLGGADVFVFSIVVWLLVTKSGHIFKSVDYRLCDSTSDLV